MSVPNIEKPFVDIKFLPSKLKLTWGFTTHMKKMEDSSYACYVPSFDLYFSAKSKEGAQKKSVDLIRLYFDFFLKDGKSDLKNLLLDLHKLGFHTKNNTWVLSKLLKKNPINTKFKYSGTVPSHYEVQEEGVYNDEYELAS